MRDKDTRLIYEAYGDEHNPPDNPGPNSGDVYAAMDKQSGIDYLRSKYQGMGESQLRAHLYVLTELLEMSEEERVRATGEDGY